MIKTVDDNFDKAIWNSCAPHPLQSWEWGEARAATGLEVVRIGEFVADSLKKTFQLTLHKIPHTKYKLGYLARSEMPTDELIEYLKEFGKNNSCIFIKIEPYTISSKSEIRNPKLIQSPHSLFPEWTLWLDLGKSEDTLLAGMKSKTRYNVRLAQKKGVTIREETNDAGFEIFQKLYFETCKRQSYHGHNYDYHKAIFDALSGNIAHILIAYYESTPIAAYEVFIFNGRLYYTYGGSSDKHRNTMATNLLMWETIRFGKKKGAKTFDMWNSLPQGYDASHPWAGFTRFKEGYGAGFTHLTPGMDLIIKPSLYWLYNKIYSLRSLILQIK